MFAASVQNRQRPGIADYAIVSLAAWTLACNAIVFLHGTLLHLLFAGTLSVVAAISLISRMAGRPDHSFGLDTSRQSWQLAWSMPRWVGVACALVIPILLNWSWIAFSTASLLLLLALVAWRLPEDTSPPIQADTAARWLLPIMAIAMAILALWVSRPDQDDAFYVGVAAFASGHPHEALLAFDPMLVERAWPLIFPSYRFASYELLGATLAWVTGMPAAATMHILLPPLFGALAVIATWELARVLAPARASTIVATVFVLTLLLGEMPRSPANFSFDRIFQGKAILLSVVLPYLFATSLRYASSAGTRRDLMLVGASYLAAIGVSNFGMLIAPMVGVTAACSALVAIGGWQRTLKLMLMALIPLPYLGWVAYQSHDGQALAAAALEPPFAIWHSTFGGAGSFIVASLLLLGPAVAPDSRLRRLLACPPIILLLILLNPLLAPLISHYLTTPPVYWRVTWQTPILIYAATALVFALRRGALPSGLRVAVAIMAIMSIWKLLPTQTLRSDNSVQWSFATVKTDRNATIAADLACSLTAAGRLLAPDAVSGIAAMRESHPTLVSAREMYIYLLRGVIPAEDYQRRMRLDSMVNNGEPLPVQLLKQDLDALDVRTIVTQSSSATGNNALGSSLAEAGFTMAQRTPDYVLWTRREAAP